MRHRRMLLGLVPMIAMVGVAFAGEIDADLQEIMNAQPAGKTISALVYLESQVDLDGLTAALDGERATLKQRHEEVVTSLQAVAASTQGNLLDYLGAMRDDGKVDDFEAFWIANAIRVEATPEQLAEIAKHPAVGKVYFNYEIELIAPVEVKDAPAPTDATSSLVEINAPQAWALGYDGTGILVANMDTGVAGNHPALASRWAGVADPRYAGHPEWAWYDPYSGQNDFPYDNNGHGTHTMGTVCGGAPGQEIGVAPGAIWMASAPIDRGGGIPQTVSDAILSFQWMVDPDGNPATNWDVPAVCSNSWGVTTGHGYPPCDETFWSFLDANEAAGTVILFSAGNEGTSGLRRPSDRATDEYRTCAVAAVDCESYSYPWPLASFSSQGPTYCTPDGSVAIKPDIAAPGVDVYSATPSGGYTTMSGTSMASPHVNGVVALIRQACPDLTVPEVKQVLYDTAIDLGPAGEDNQFGWGNIDALAAVERALELCIDDEGRLDLDAGKYNCEDEVLMIVRDLGPNLDPNAIDTVDIVIASDSEPAGEIVTCIETAVDRSRFEAMIVISATDAPGVLLVGDGDTITATYIDLDNGQGQQVTVTAQAVVDCTPPVISNVHMIEVEPRNAEVGFDTDEPCFGIVHYGLACDALNETAVGAGYSTSPTIAIAGLQDNTTYYYMVEAEDEAGNVGSDPDCRSFTTPEVPDFFTELFASGFDLANLTLTFEPNGSNDFYVGCVEQIIELPTDPTGGTTITLSDDDNESISAGGSVYIYGAAYTSVFVGSNGYITFGGGDTDYTESLEDHFDTPRVAALFDDLNPSSAGTVSYRTLDDRLAVTWLGVTEYGQSNSNTFQIEMFYDGMITISYLEIAVSDALAGLSDGSGLDPDYFPSDLSNMGSCGPRPPSATGDEIEVPVDTPAQIELIASDDGLPGPLSYIVTALPLHGTLTDVGNAYVIGAVPYTLFGNGNVVEYTPNGGYYGDDAFTFKVDDGGTPPEGGESNEATILITVLYGAPRITTNTLPDGCLGQAYSFELQAAGGQPELAWMVLPGSDYTEFDLGESLFSAVGTGQGWQADDGAWQYTLPFTFIFYGQSYDSVWVCSNGFMDFAGSNTGYVNSTASLIANVRIAPLWDDLKTYSPHDIYIDAGLDYVTIRWDAETYGDGYPANFAATLFADGRIQFHYGSGNTGLTPTVGISSGNGSDYTLSMYNDATTLTDVNSVEYVGISPLPAGLSLSEGGVLSGTPTEFGLFAPAIRVADSLGRSDEVQLTLTIDEQCESMLGDMDCDGDVDFDDIDPFVAALGGEEAYNALYPDCNWLNADCNGDGDVDFDDIDAFVALLGG